MRLSPERSAFGSGSLLALAVLLALAPVCGALCQSSGCGLLSPAADASCHHLRASSQNAMHILPTTASCGGRELAAAMSESRLQPWRPFDPAGAALPPAVSAGSEPETLLAGGFERRGGPPLVAFERLFPVLRI